jgi:hypothetical protein
MAGKGDHRRPASPEGRFNWEKFWDERAALDKTLEDTNQCQSTTTSVTNAGNPKKPSPCRSKKGPRP